MLATALTFGLRLSAAALVVIAASCVLDMLVRRVRRVWRKRRNQP